MWGLSWISKLPVFPLFKRGLIIYLKGFIISCLVLYSQLVYQTLFIKLVTLKYLLKISHVKCKVLNAVCISNLFSLFLWHYLTEQHKDYKQNQMLIITATRDFASSLSHLNFENLVVDGRNIVFFRYTRWQHFPRTYLV